MTSLAEARTAVRTRFETLIATALSVTVFFENARGDVPANAAWCDLVLREVQSERVEVGHEFLVRDRGLAIAYLYAPVGAGSKTADDIADAIEAGFAHVIADGVTYLETRKRTIGVEGGWFRMSVEISFYSERIKTAA